MGAGVFRLHLVLGFADYQVPLKMPDLVDDRIWMLVAARTWLSAPFYASLALALRANRFDGVVELVLCRVEVLFGFRAVTLHIIVVGGAGTIHFFDGFIYVVVGRFEIVPVTNPFGNGDPGNKRQTRGKNSNCNCFRHNFLSSL
jgi:hypothetical protein